jgi:hypothetical protein
MAFDAPVERAVRWDILIQQGSTFERTLEFIDVDLAAFQFRGQIRRSHDDDEILASFDFLKTGPSELQISMSAVVTQGLPAEPLVHDIEAFIDETGFVARVLEGKVDVTPEVTR